MSFLERANLINSGSRDNQRGRVLPNGMLSYYREPAVYSRSNEN